MFYTSWISPTGTGTNSNFSNDTNGYATDGSFATANVSDLAYITPSYSATNIGSVSYNSFENPSSTLQTSVTSLDTPLSNEGKALTIAGVAGDLDIGVELLDSGASSLARLDFTYDFSSLPQNIIIAGIEVEAVYKYVGTTFSLDSVRIRFKYFSNVIVDASATGYTSATTSTSVTVSHIVASTSNLLVAEVGWSGTSTTISSVTYNGVAMTKLVEQNVTSSYRQAIYYLENPDAGTHNVVVTASASSSILVGTTSFLGAAIPSVIGTPSTGSGSGIVGASSVSASQAGSLVLDMFSIASSGTSIPSVIGQQIQLFTQGSTAHNNQGAGSYNAYPNVALDMRWSISGISSRSWGQMIIMIPAASVSSVSGNMIMMFM